MIAPVDDRGTSSLLRENPHAPGSQAPTAAIFRTRVTRAAVANQADEGSTGTSRTRPTRWPDHPGGRQRQDFSGGQTSRLEDGRGVLTDFGSKASRSDVGAFDVQRHGDRAELAGGMVDFRE